MNKKKRTMSPKSQSLCLLQINISSHSLFFSGKQLSIDNLVVVSESESEFLTSILFHFGAIECGTIWTELHFSLVHFQNYPEYHIEYNSANNIETKNEEYTFFTDWHHKPNKL